MLNPPATSGYAALWDWRRRVAALYSAVRDTRDPRNAWHAWRRGRDELFRHHPQSPLDHADREQFSALPYYSYDPALRFEIGLREISKPSWAADAGSDGAISLTGFAETEGLAATLGRELTVYWIKGYGGGAFLPFADATTGEDTYGGGRYLLDTIKGADLGVSPSGQTVLDFNFAYAPSCSYSTEYACPLSPAENRLAAAIRAGERSPAE